MTAINFDSYNLVHEKLSYYVRCKDKLFESPSILIICSIEAVISMLVLIWSVYLGYSLSNTKKIDDNWKAVFETKGR